MEILTEMEEMVERICQLPEVIEKVFVKKRYAGAPNVAALKDQQLEAYTAMIEFLKEENGGMFLLKGYAGTGKTFTIGQVIETYLQNDRSGSIAMTAPTNKAVKVLKKAAEFTHTNMKFLTIHSLLGLKEQITNHGEQIFVQDKKNPPKIEEYSVLIVDETSMLSDDLFLGNSQSTGIVNYVGEFEGHKKTKEFTFSSAELQTVIKSFRSSGLKVIFMGDPCQIPPVGKNDCLPFDEEAHKTYHIETAELTEIVRQAKGNPIIETTLQIRNSLGRPVTFPAPESNIDEEGKGVIFFAQGQRGHSENVEKLLEVMFCSENFKADADFAKVIAWTNKTVNTMNRYIRAMIYGDEAKNSRIMIGEKLIANKPIIEGPVVIFSTNDEMEVVSYLKQIEKINGGKENGGADIMYYSTEVKYEMVENGREMSAIIKIVAQESMDDYENIIEKLRQVAKSFKQGSWEAGRAWQDFYTFQENFADVNYNYAITAHKSQGSTYDHAFIFANDIDKNSKITERNRIKYTACSRPKRTLMVIC